MKTFKTKRHFFTLLELMLVLSVIALVAGVIGVNINKALREQRFKTEVSVVVDQLRLAQNLMLILDSDAHLFMASDRNGTSIKMWVELDDTGNHQWIERFKQNPKILKTIQFVEFNDELKNQNKTGMIDIKFLSGGMVMSKGIIRLSTSQSKSFLGSLEKFICLTGTPKPIQSGSESKNECLIETVFNSNDETLTLHTQQEIGALTPDGA